MAFVQQSIYKHTFSIIHGSAVGLQPNLSRKSFIDAPREPSGSRYSFGEETAYALPFDVPWRANLGRSVWCLAVDDRSKRSWNAAGKKQESVNARFAENHP